MKVDTDVDFTQFFTPKTAAGTAGMDDKFQPFHVKSVDTERRQITGVASAEIIDRDGEIVTIAALKIAIKDYMNNPVILASHAHETYSGNSPVVGKVVSYTFKGKELQITVEFADTELGLEYWKLYKDKYQRAFSIGFRIRRSHLESREGKQIRVIDEIELYEISCVAVPANPAALSKAKTFVLRKQIEREKQRIKDDDDAFVDLFGRLEAIEREHGGILKDAELLGTFSPAEQEIIKELEQAGADLYGPDAEDWPYDEINDDSDDEDDDYSKTIVGDHGAFYDEMDSGGNDEPDYF